MVGLFTVKVSVLIRPADPGLLVLGLLVFFAGIAADACKSIT
jgi:hypothetical protein